MTAVIERLVAEVRSAGSYNANANVAPERLLVQRRVSAVPTTVWEFFNKRDITSKKTAHASEQQRKDVKAARVFWVKGAA